MNSVIKRCWIESSLFKRVLRQIALLSTLVVLSACVRNVSSIKADYDVLANESDGYLYIRINTQSNLDTLEISGPANIRLSRADLRKGTNAIVVPLPAGKYQIDRIYQGRGYYTLDDEKDLWSFIVKPGVISYVGDLEVERSEYNRSFFELVNNSSAALEYLEAKFPKVLGSRGIEYWGPGEDYFFDFLRQQEFIRGKAEPEVDPSAITTISPSVNSTKP
jgi:hypothetical protein